MFRIDKTSKTATMIEPTTFQAHGLTERHDLQEWIANNPSLLNENLMIIQKEFSGFEGTQERLDLLALDEEGSLVIIENKLDDSGTEVAWQALKYASYFAACEENQIIQLYSDYKNISLAEAEKEICLFVNRDVDDELSFNSDDPRIILIAREFRREVTSVALWLIDKGVRIQCMKVIPYTIGDHFVVDLEQIVPLPEKNAEEYRVRVTNKRLEENRKNKNAKRFASSSDFLRSLKAPYLKERYSNLFDYANEMGWTINLGVKGFSVNVIAVNNIKVSLFRGYGDGADTAPSSIVTKFGLLQGRIENSIIEYYKNEFESGKLPFFSPTSESNYKWELTEQSSDEEMRIFLSVVRCVSKKIRANEDQKL